MPKEEATFDPFSTHLIPKNFKILQKKSFFENVGLTVCFFSLIFQKMWKQPCTFCDPCQTSKCADSVWFFVCHLFARVVKLGVFFSLHMAFIFKEFSMSASSKLAVTCSARAKVLKSRWGKSHLPEAHQAAPKLCIILWVNAIFCKTLQHTICPKKPVKTCPFDFCRQLINEWHAENEQGKDQASIWCV